MLAALREGAARVAAGDRALLPSIQPAVATSARGLGASGHYLPANRLEWWGARPWKSGPFKKDRPTGSGTLAGNSNEAFLCEFNPALATVVGTDLADGSVLPAMLPYRRVQWDGRPGVSPNAVADIGFTVRSHAPESTPLITAVPIQFGSEAEPVERNVLVNAVAEGFTPDPSVRRADLVLDFDVPQRAVGLEFAWGRIGDEDHPWVVDVEIEARAADGTLLILTSPDNPEERNDAHYLANADEGHSDVSDGWSRLEDGWIRFIGTRDELGRISTIALRFNRRRSFDETTTFPFIIGPQILYRVWYEPLPGAVVKQDQVQFSRDSAGAITATGSATLDMPFGCDRAIAVLRGFRTEFPEHREIWGLDIGVEADVNPSTRKVTVLLTGPSRYDLQVPPFTNRAYYALIAWDSRQVDLITIAGRAELSQPEDDQLIYGALDTPDPCPDAPLAVESETLARCGPIAAYLTGFAFEFPETCELDQWTWRAADAYRQVRGGRSAVRWPIGATARGDGETPGIHVTGSVLGGRGLLPFVEAVRRDAEGHELGGFGISFDRQGYRADGAFSPSEPNAQVFPVQADMAFIGIRYFSMDPGDEIRQVDIEVKATDYDGNRLTWVLGAGVATENDGTERNTIIGYPSTAGIARRHRFGGPRLEVQGVRWANTAAGTRSGAAARYGVVRNSGDLVAIITDVRVDGAQADEFHFSYAYQGQTIDEDALSEHLPLILRPGEALMVGGYFSPAASGTRQASLLFTTNDRNSLTVALPVLGETVAADPAFVWSGHVNFGNINVGSRLTKRMGLMSSGTTALVVSEIRVESPLLGFSVAGLSHPIQIPAGDLWVITVHVHPTAVGVLKTNIVVETNAGQGKFPVQATAIAGPVTLPPPGAPGRPTGGPGRH